MAEIDYVQEGANLKINSAYKSIMKESKQNFIDGMNAYQAKDYPKAKALITKAKNSFEKGYWSIYDADKPAEGKTTPMAAGMFTGNIASGTLGVYRTLKENKIFKKYFPNAKFDINEAAERKIVQAATLGLQQDNSKAPYLTLNDFKRDMSLIVNAYRNACEYVLEDIDKKMGRQKPTTESFYMEDEEMHDNLSMYDLIKLESTLAYYEKQEEAMEGTNTKLTFGYAKAMKDGRKFLQEAKNLLSIKNYKDARDNVFKARKCFVAAYNEINNLPESKISSATGKIMSAIVGTARIINASNELSDFKGYKWAAKLHDVAAVRQLLRQVNIIVGNSSVTNASIYERKRSVAPTNAKFTSNVYKKDILMIIKAYIEVCEVMMRDIGSTHSAAKESAAAIEEYYTDMLHMGAVMEGKNLDVNRKFGDSLTAGNKELEKALMYMRSDRYTEAIEHLDTASDKFETAIQDIHDVNGGILADTIIGGIMRDFVGTYRMFVAASNLKSYGQVGKDWGTKLRIRSVIRILYICGLPGAGVIDMGMNVGRRVTNTRLEVERGKHKKFTFNGFKEDCINVLNAYLETINDLKDKVKEAQNGKLSYQQADILG